MVGIKLFNYRTQTKYRKVLEGENSVSLPVLWLVFRVMMPYIHCNHNEIKPKHFSSHTQAPISIHLVSYDRILHLLEVHTTPNNLETAGALFSSGVLPSHDSDTNFPRGSIFFQFSILSKGKSAEAPASKTLVFSTVPKY